ncbi:MAG: DUF2182 domain-containing protein [Myxococcota bacterium]
MSPLSPPAARSLRLRDRRAVLAALAGVTLLAWIYLVILAQRMGEMPGMEGMLALRPWTGLDFALMLLMWAAMMVGMMVPSAIPMVLVYAAVSQKAAGQGSPLPPTAIFASGYVVAWTLFSVGATFAQWGLERTALLSPSMVATSPTLGAALVVAAGLYQFTPAKQACLRHCRSPAHFISEHWKPGALGALRMGLEHGAYCLGCCWVLMGLLFFGGVMNLLWVAAITVFVLLEKLLPSERLVRWAGLALMGTGTLLLALAWMREGGS